jgi:hypothetical protein
MGYDGYEGLQIFKDYCYHCIWKFYFLFIMFGVKASLPSKYYITRFYRSLCDIPAL